MCEIIEFPLRAAMERHPPKLRAYTAHEQPAVRLFFRTPDGLVHRATVHTTFNFNDPEVSEEQRDAYHQAVARSVQTIGGELLELCTLGSVFMEMGGPSDETRWLMELEQAIGEPQKEFG